MQVADLRSLFEEHRPLGRQAYRGAVAFEKLHVMMTFELGDVLAER